LFSIISRFIGWISWLILFGTCIGLAFLVGFFSQVVQEMPLLDKLSVPQPVEASRIYTIDNQLLGNVYAEKGNRILLPYDQIPDNLKKALIAIEDKDFYKHRGVDLRGITRAAKANLEGGRIEQGGSTITQQLIRKLYLEKESDTLDKFMRKIKEIIISLRLETRYSKDEILTFYLNEMFFGSNSYGVEAASQNYFGKSARDLTLAECAMLAGIPQAPSVLNPYASLEKATARRNLVLKAMLKENYIDQAKYDDAIKEKVRLTGSKGGGYRDLKHPYFATYVLEQAKEIVGQRNLYFGGLRIYTTLDTEAQTIAEKKITETVLSDKLRKANISQGAFVLLDVKTGAIRAMVGGVDFDKNEYNRAWQSERQPGSAFKPFVYITALEQGYSPSSLIIDKPVSFDDGSGKRYTPQNYDHTYQGIMTMKQAIERSRNVPAIKTCDLVKPEEVVRWARNLGIHNGKMDAVISLGLGSCNVSMLEITNAYSTIANDGVFNKPFAIRLITDSQGKVIYQYKPNAYRVAPKNLARLMTYMLKGVVTQGTGTKAKLTRECAGKTGTTSDYKDAWFIGYTPEYAAAVWVGNDDEAKKMYRVTGGTYPAQIWHDIMQAVTVNLPESKFDPPLRYPSASMSLEPTLSQAQLDEMLKVQKGEAPAEGTAGETPAESTGTIPSDGEGGDDGKKPEPYVPF
jgi:penicillin-binding protein 1A